MKTVGFIGAYDKTDLIVYVAKILALTGKNILIIDASTLQKAKYLIPSISPAMSYITQFEEMDIAVGLYNYESIKAYLGMAQQEVLQYDYILLDIDSPEAFQSFGMQTANKNYFVSGFDVYSLKRGLEILSGLREPIPLTKIFYSKKISVEEEEYFNFISLGTRAIWNEEKIYFPFEQGDQTTIIENQIVSKIKFKKLTQLYKDSLLYLTEDIVDNNQESASIKKAFKQLEKGV